MVWNVSQKAICRSRHRSGTAMPPIGGAGVGARGLHATSTPSNPTTSNRPNVVRVARRRCGWCDDERGEEYADFGEAMKSSSQTGNGGSPTAGDELVRDREAGAAISSYVRRSLKSDQARRTGGCTKKGAERADTEVAARIRALRSPNVGGSWP
jgi:hypothetical protein